MAAMVIALFGAVGEARAQTGSAPTITQATVPGSGGYFNGTVDITLRFSASVNVTGTPQIPVTIGGTTHRVATYVAGSSTTDLVFRYSVISGADDGVIAFANTIALNGGTIRDASGHDAALSFTAPDTSAYYADGVAPAPPVITSITQSATPTLTGTSEANSRVSVMIHGMGGQVVANLGANGTGWEYDWYDTPLPAGTYSVVVYAYDRAGNLSNASAPFSLVVPASTEPGGRDITPPKINYWEVAPLDAAEPNTVRFIVHFTEPVTGVDAGDVTVAATGDAHGTVGTPQPDATGASYILPVEFSGSSGTLTLSIPGGTAANIQDLAGNLFGNGQDSYASFTLPPPNAPVITSPLQVDATVGTAFTYTITASGSPTSYGVGSTLPAWMSFDASTHTLSGTPTVSDKFGITLTATNAAGTGSSPLTIDVHTTSGVSGGVNDQPPVVTDATVTGRVGVAIDPVQVQATGSPTVFNAPDLASYGLAIDHFGVITGKPTAAADGVAIAVVAANPTGNSEPAKITLHLAADGSSGTGSGNTAGVPVVSDATVSGQVGLTLKPVQLQATGSPTLFDAPGLAVYGLSVDHTGVISGIPTAAANNVTVRVTAANPDGTSSPASIVLNIAPGDQTIAVTPPKPKVTTDAPVSLDATASSGLPVSYSVVSGPATISGNQVVFTGSGTVVVKAVQPGSDSYHPTDTTLTFSAVPVDRLVNISSRMHLQGAATGPSIAGFVVTGSEPKQLLIRAVGPSLAQLGVGDPVADVRLQLFDSSGKMVAENSGWNDATAVASAGNAVGAFKLLAGSKDAALLETLAPGAYTAQVTSSTSGTALVEVYDAAATAAVPTKQLINISTRATVDAGQPMIAGFVVSGTDPKQVLIRGVGPTLSVLHVPGVLADPVLKVYDAKGNVIAQNDNWETAESGSASSASDIAAAESASGAFALPSGSADAALVLSLPPGQYTAEVSSANNTAGTALVEVYEVP